MARLDEILSANERYTAGHKSDPPSGLSEHARRELCIITCMDPRLVKFFPSALGVERGDAVLVRLPGGSVLTANGDGLRAVAATVYINKATEFLVMGHTDCGTTKVDNGVILSEMQKRGVPTQSMPGGPRAFLGAIPDMRQAVKASAAAIRSAPFLPRDLLVHAAILNIETGELEIVERGENYQGESQIGGADTLGYRAGPSASLGSGLGDGLSHLTGAGASALFDSGAALKSNADPFAGLASQIPPGWSDGTSALSSRSTPITEVQPAQSAMAAPAPMATAIPLTSSIPLTPEQVAPAPARPAAPAPAPAPRRMPVAKARAADPELDANVAKVREFYRHNFTQDQRRKILKSLAHAARGDMAATEQVRIVVKPILDLGQKRYKVIDEVIAIKERASSMLPHDAFALLSQLFD